uniref:Homeobox domain-containing protein n=1 Tax=Amazona collaria TaxID=241587 RepID=A0A8B9G0F7_9PSIT
TAVPPASKEDKSGLSERGPAAAGEMEKGPFSVEWLAQSSRGGAWPTAAAPCSPTGDIGGRGNAANSGESRCGTVGAARAAAACVTPSALTPDRVSSAASRDREAADRSSPGREAEAGSGTGRPRTKFSAAQLQELERSFREQRYIGARTNGLFVNFNFFSPQIKTWFQNRRMKFKRQARDARVEALFSGLFLPYCCYPDIATSNYSHGTDVNIPYTSPVSLHPAMPSPALLLPSVPAQSLHPVFSSLALLLPSSRGLSCYSSAIPAMTLTDDHKRLRFQPYLPSC